jgi:hypothetical protein
LSSGRDALQAGGASHAIRSPREAASRLSGTALEIDFGRLSELRASNVFGVMRTPALAISDGRFGRAADRAMLGTLADTST